MKKLLHEFFSLNFIKLGDSVEKVISLNYVPIKELLNYYVNEQHNIYEGVVLSSK